MDVSFGIFSIVVVILFYSLKALQFVIKSNLSFLKQYRLGIKKGDTKKSNAL